MQLIPRFQNWIQTYYPGTKLSFSEYSFASGTNPLVDMLTETDVLGIYGRQGLDFANMWNVPAPTAPLAYSFRIYRNYDGAGSQFGDTSVNSTSTDQSQLSVYGALRSSDGVLTVVAINKTTSPIQTALTLANFNSTANAAVYTYSNANLSQIVAGTPVALASNALNYNFPAYSATVLVFTPQAAPPAGTTTSLTASNTELTSGQNVTLTATVAPQSGSGTPAGSVSFSDGANSIGTGALSSETASFSTSSLTTGLHSITATYSGDSNFATSTSSILTVTVSPPTKTPTAVSVTPSATQLTAGQSLTLNISVAPQSGTGTPTGTVAILDGQTQLAAPTLAAGAASFSTSTLAVGTHTIAVNYSGDSNFSPATSAATTVTVQAAPAADFSLSMSASTLNVTAGTSGTITLTVSPLNGFKQAVNFVCSGLPSGTSCTFNPQLLTPTSGPSNATMTIQTPAAAAAVVPGAKMARISGMGANLYTLPRMAALYIFTFAIFGICATLKNAAEKHCILERPNLLHAFLGSALLAVMLIASSCSSFNVQQPSATAKSYTVTVTASGANSLTHSQSFTLTITP